MYIFPKFKGSWGAEPYKPWNRNDSIKMVLIR